MRCGGAGPRVANRFETGLPAGYCGGVFSRSRVDRPSRSSRVTITTSPPSSWSSKRRSCARSVWLRSNAAPRINKGASVFMSLHASLGIGPMTARCCWHRSYTPPPFAPAGLAEKGIERDAPHCMLLTQKRDVLCSGVRHSAPFLRHHGKVWCSRHG